MALETTTFCMLQRHGDDRDRHGVELRHALSYCATLALLFVASLYLLVPRHVRQLDRNDARQIKWRSASTLVVCLVSCASYPLVFCKGVDDATWWPPSMPQIAATMQREFLATVSVMLHTMVLFAGPILQCILAAYVAIQSKEGKVTLTKWSRVMYAWYVQPIQMALFTPRQESERWIVLRNLCLAPLTEEIVFRGCMVPALRSTGMSVGAVSCVAPLFFGVAHVHHAMLKLQQPDCNLRHVMVQTLVQFAYTTLFGMYESYAYLQTRSLLAVTLCHAFCNAMGLPDVASYHQHHASPLYRYRMLLSTALMCGVVGFAATLTYWQWPSSVALAI